SHSLRSCGIRLVLMVEVSTIAGPADRALRGPSPGTSTLSQWTQMGQAWKMSELTATSQAGDAARALSCLDLTSLNLDDTPESINALCDRALSPAPGIELHPAAVCIYPKFAGQVRERLAGTGIAVAAVANFPLGTSPLDEVVNEVEQALADGADEIDVVFPFRAYLAGDHLAAGELVQ